MGCLQSTPQQPEPRNEFDTVKKGGITMKLYSIKHLEAPKEGELTYTNGRLALEGAKRDSSFDYSIYFDCAQLKCIVKGGKYTMAFNLLKDSLCSDDDLLFSIIGDKKVMNLQCESKEDRDIWVKGLRDTLYYKFDSSDHVHDAIAEERWENKTTPESFSKQRQKEFKDELRPILQEYRPKYVFDSETMDTILDEVAIETNWVYIIKHGVSEAGYYRRLIQEAIAMHNLPENEENLEKTVHHEVIGDVVFGRDFYGKYPWKGRKEDIWLNENDEFIYTVDGKLMDEPTEFQQSDLGKTYDRKLRKVQKGIRRLIDKESLSWTYKIEEDIEKEIFDLFVTHEIVWNIDLENKENPVESEDNVYSEKIREFMDNRKDELYEYKVGDSRKFRDYTMIKKDADYHIFWMNSTETCKVLMSKESNEGFIEKHYRINDGLEKKWTADYKKSLDYKSKKAKIEQQRRSKKRKGGRNNIGANNSNAGTESISFDYSVSVSFGNCGTGYTYDDAALGDCGGGGDYDGGDYDGGGDGGGGFDDF